MSERRARLRRALALGLLGLIFGVLANLMGGFDGGPFYAGLNGLLIGSLIGLFESSRWFARQDRLPYYVVVLIRTAMYAVIWLVTTILVLVLFVWANGVRDLESLQQRLPDLSIRFNGPSFFLVLGFTFALGFVGQMMTLLGRGVLLNYMVGRYRRPRVEPRVVMFLDLSSATSVAEKLGPHEYSLLLQDFFRDIDDAITESSGSVLQYVGDEVVVAWHPDEAREGQGCLGAVTGATAALLARAPVYEMRFGVRPEFKAALHYGDVTITEVGVSKKEIAYHGDTMNTTSRVCALCNRLGRSLLLTQAVMDELSLHGDGFEDLGEHELRGRNEPVRLFALSSESPRLSSTHAVPLPPGTTG